MSFARYARKERLKTGAQKQIAAKLGVGEAVVSLVMNDKAEDARVSAPTIRRVRVAIARRLGQPVAEVFPPEGGMAA